MQHALATMKSSTVQKVHRLESAKPAAGDVQAARDEDNTSDQNIKHVDSRAHTLRLKQEAYQKSFDSFIQSCSEHQPAAAGMFKKFWYHAISLADNWKELYDMKQQQLDQIHQQHEQLQQDHQVLKNNLRGLKMTVQNMLGDVSALLQHAGPESASSDAVHDQQQHNAAVPLPGQSEDAQLGPSRSTSVSSGGSNDSATQQADEQAQAVKQMLQPQPSAAPTAPGPRRSAQIVSSLISSIEKMSKQFAECHAGKLTSAATDGLHHRVSTGNSSKISSGDSSRHPIDKQRRTAASHVEGSSTVEVPLVNTELADSRNSSSTVGSRRTGATGHKDSTVAASKPNNAARTGKSQAVASCTHPEAVPAANAAATHEPQRQQPVSSKSQQRSAAEAATEPAHEPSSKRKSSADAATFYAIPAALAGAQPSRSHPPSNSKVAPSPETAQRHTLAWFQQNAGSPYRLSSSMPSPSTATPTAAEAPGSAGSAASITAVQQQPAVGEEHSRQSAGVAAAAPVIALDSAASGFQTVPAAAPATTVDTNTNSHLDGPVLEPATEPDSQLTHVGGKQQSNGVVQPRPASAARVVPQTDRRQQVLSPEASVSYWMGPSTASLAGGGIRSGSSSRAGYSAASSRSSSRASLGSHPAQAARTKQGVGFGAVPEAALSAPAAAAGARSTSRASGRSSARSSSASLTAIVRSRQQQQKQQAAGIYQYEEQSDGPTSGRATSSMVAAAAAKLGLQLQQQQHLVHERLGPGSSRVAAVATAAHRQLRTAAGVSVVAAAAASRIPTVPEGPLTAALHRQESLKRASSGSLVSSRQPQQAAIPAVPGQAAGAPSRTRSHGKPSDSGSAVTSPTAVHDSTAQKPNSRPSSSGGRYRAPRQAAAGGVASSKQTQQPRRPASAAATPTAAAAAGRAQHAPLKPPAKLESPPSAAAADLQGSSLRSQQQPEESPTKSAGSGTSSSSSEQSDMVLLGSCASAGWSNQTSPAYEGTASRRTSPADAATAALAAAGVSRIMPGQSSDNSPAVAATDSEPAPKQQSATSAPGIRGSGSAARALDLSKSADHIADVQLVPPEPAAGATAAVVVAVDTGEAVAVTTVVTTAVAAQDSMAAAGEGSPLVPVDRSHAPVENSVKEVIDEAVQEQQLSELRADSVMQQRAVLPQQEAAPDDAVDASKGPAAGLTSEQDIAAEHSPKASKAAPDGTAAGTVQAAPAAPDQAAADAEVNEPAPADWPDAIKLTNREDSPKKQRHKTPPAPAAAQSASRGSGDGKRTLHRKSSHHSTASPESKDPPKIHSDGSSNSARPQPDEQQEASGVSYVQGFAETGFCQPSSPASPLSPISKRFRSSCDHLLLRLRYQQQLQEGEGDVEQQAVLLHEPQLVMGNGSLDFAVVQSSVAAEVAALCPVINEQGAGEADRTVDRQAFSSSDTSRRQQQQTPADGVAAGTEPADNPVITGVTSQNSSSTVYEAALAAVSQEADASPQAVDVIASIEGAAVPDAAAAVAAPAPAPMKADTHSSDSGSYSSVMPGSNHNIAAVEADVVTNHDIAAAEAELPTDTSAMHSSKVVTRLASYPVAVSIESHITASSDFSWSHEQQHLVAAGEPFSIGGSRLAAVTRPDPTAASFTDFPEVTAVTDSNSAAKADIPARTEAAGQAQRLAAGTTTADPEISPVAATAVPLQQEDSWDEPADGIATAAHTDMHANGAVTGYPDFDAASSGAETAPDEAVGSKQFNLQELVSIVLDVMDCKADVDQECGERHLPNLAPTHHLQRYIKQKVLGDDVQYTRAMTMMLSSLDQYKDQQPEAAVYCRVLAGEIDEDYFQQHLALRSYLQLLATHALLQQPHQQHAQQDKSKASSSSSRSKQSHGTQAEQQQQARSYDQCCSDVMDDAQLSWLLGVWGRQRSSVMVRPCSPPGAVQPEQQLHRDWWKVVHKHCGSGAVPRLTAGVVDALLLWELEQQVSRLGSVVDAFKTADIGHRGLLDLQQFVVFCYELNDAMPESEVHALFVDELDKHGVGLVTFNNICRCLLPAM